MIISNVLPALRYSYRLGYQVVRLPLQVIEQQVMGRLNEQSPVRLSYERSLGLLDATAGHLLAAPEVRERGAALIRRSDALRRAGRLTAAADAGLAEANAEVRQAYRDAEHRQEHADETAEREVRAAREDAQRHRRTVVANTQRRVSAGVQRAGKVAAARKNTVEAQRRSRTDRIAAAEHAVTADADATLIEANAERAAAAGARAEADRVEQLAATEKRNRRR
ncbi:hypothetical protein MHAS_04609 [Mycolicibacterium hassiacum DSM 44199]|jgi:hypothetical protein|uniref:hypothetical protein n=1 Tax=Mycolicibacterium hassiacum TaxID=46351 RepID=UPI0004759042|nr:hypothetical protein [Mycolicibacterium hassiacum]MBX5486580.1 hypothetical protein [Mycolicibacterium hassiacum]VCT92874.1 hypothetical protein MHAS_04609 [Mycolicibacterium hassiacum DSM 44199]